MIPRCKRGPNGTPCGRAGTGPKTVDQCSRCWIALNSDLAVYSPLPKYYPPLRSRVSLASQRLDRCIFLREQVEFKSGCRSGVGCLHACQKGLPAVPNKSCQECESYIAHKRVNPLHPVPWVGDFSDFAEDREEDPEAQSEKEPEMDLRCKHRSVGPHPLAKVAAHKGLIPLGPIWYRCNHFKSFVSPEVEGDRHCGTSCSAFVDVHDPRKVVRRPAEALLQCVNNLGATGEKVDCEGCRGTKVSTFKCKVHEVCTVLKPVPGVHCCDGCLDWNDRVTAVAGAPPERKGIIWKYGLTSVPSRMEELTKATLESLKGGGFPEPHLFIDGEPDGDKWRKKFGLNVTARYPNIRTYGNWVLSLAELYISNPHADRYAIFQDDFITYPGLRDYLESCDFPEKGYWNLYSFPQNEKRVKGRQVGWHESNQKGLGAVALVFSQHGVRTLLSSPYMVDRPLDPKKGWRGVDGGIVSAMKLQGWKEYFHWPSLVQHTGAESSMGNKRHRQSTTFRGPRFNARDLIKEKR